MLYLVPTPIGNLSDITLRAIEILKEVSLILCEDTRTSAVLLKKYDIVTKTLPYHKFNEKEELSRWINALKNGESIALISDAGTPGISDPGEILVRECIKENIIVTPLPGPCALISALIGSGLPTLPFQFLGYLPKKDGEKEMTLIHLLLYPGTTIAYESPHRIIKTLKTIDRLAPEREVVVARELSKKFETFHRGIAKDVITQLPEKGEMALLISPPSKEQLTHFGTLSPEEIVNYLSQTFNLSIKEAIKITSSIHPIGKRELYQLMINKEHI